MMVQMTVSGMTCGHCRSAVTEAIRARDPAARIEVLLDQGMVRVETSLPRAEIAAAIEKEGYSISA